MEIKWENTTVIDRAESTKLCIERYKRKKEQLKIVREYIEKAVTNSHGLEFKSASSYQKFMEKAMEMKSMVDVEMEVIKKCEKNPGK